MARITAIYFEELIQQILEVLRELRKTRRAKPVYWQRIEPGSDRIAILLLNKSDFEPADYYVSMFL